MKVRIVFRGLVFYVFRKAGGTEQLTALLVNKSHAGHGHDAAHDHHPLVQWAGDGDVTVLKPANIKGKRFKFSWGATGGITREQSFEDHVPSLSALLKSKVTVDKKYLGNNPGDLITCQVVVPRGRLWTRELVAWSDPPEPRTPQIVYFFGSAANGHVASEAAVEAETDDATVTLTTCNFDGSAETVKQIGPYTTGQNYQHEVEPDTVEFVFSQHSPQRDPSVPWTVHFQWFFELLPRGSYAKRFDKAHIERLEGRLNRERKAVWAQERDACTEPDGDTRRGLPFPYTLLEGPQALKPIDETAPAHDPHDPPLCPQGRE